MSCSPETLAKAAVYRAQHRLAIREKAREAYRSDRVGAAARKRELRRLQTDDDRARIQAARRLKRDNDPIFDLSCRVRLRIAKMFSRHGYTKKSTASTIVGCDWPTLKTHIESQFVYAMGWHNRHLWHVDHRIPLARATTEAELIALCHYTNLQPLWAWVNRKKSDQ